MSCDGCSIAVTGATAPSVEDLLAGTIPGLPKVILHHPVLSISAGAEFVRPLREAAEGKLDAPYVVVLEGSVPDDQALPEDQGYFSAMGAGGFDPDSEGDQPNRVTDWLKRLCPGAAASIAIGTCATWGGVPAAAGNVTGSMSLMDFVGKDYRSALGVPVVNIPGCAPIGDNFTEVVAGRADVPSGASGPCPSSTSSAGPHGSSARQSTATVRAPAITRRASSPSRGATRSAWWISAAGARSSSATSRSVVRSTTWAAAWWPVAPASAARCRASPTSSRPSTGRPRDRLMSGGTSRVYGSAIRRLRRVTMRNRNREPLWDRTGRGAQPVLERGEEADAQLEARGLLLQQASVPGLRQPGEAQQEAAEPSEHGYLLGGRAPRWPRRVGARLDQGLRGTHDDEDAAKQVEAEDEGKE